MATKTYRSKQTGEVIGTSDTLIELDDGVVWRNAGANSYSFMPNGKMDAEEDASRYGYRKPDRPGIEHPPYDMSSFRNDIEADIVLRSHVDYEFGLDSINAGYVTPKDICGFLSDYIKIGSSSYIKLRSIAEGRYDSIEYYIIEGEKETPILPNNESEVKGEYIFAGLSTRFHVDTSKDIRIYQNRELTSYKLEDVDVLGSTKDNIFTIDYTPYENPNRYYPESDEVRIKIVQRRYTPIIPASIVSVTIERYGGELPWLTLV